MTEPTGRTPAEMSLYYQELDFVLNMMEVAAFKDFLMRWRVKLPEPPRAMTDHRARSTWTDRQLSINMRTILLSRPTAPRDAKDNALRWLFDQQYAPVPDPNAEGHIVDFIGDGRQATVPPNPAYPNGKKLRTFKDPEGIEKICTIDVPYPAPECGRYRIICRRCALTVMITAAGRPDDPTSITVACKKEK